MNKVPCTICHEPQARVPVRIICFDCNKDEEGRSCHDIARSCITCAREYFQLNKPVSEREHRKKCFFCDKTVNPQGLNASTAYVKDFLVMSMDQTVDHPCFHSSVGCPFTGRQEDLNRHLRNACNYRTITCEARCGKYFMAKDLVHHRAKCENYKICQVCNEHIPLNALSYHLRTAHRMVSCRWCSELFHTDGMSRHQEDCPSKPVRCQLCPMTIVRPDYRLHLQHHAELEMKQLDQVKERLSIVFAAMHKS
jgi:hypothetical protein